METHNHTLEKKAIIVNSKFSNIWPFPPLLYNSMRYTSGPICPVQAWSPSSSSSFLTRKRLVVACASPHFSGLSCPSLVWAEAGVKTLMCFLRTSTGRPNPEVRAKQIKENRFDLCGDRTHGQHGQLPFQNKTLKISVSSTSISFFDIYVASPKKMKGLLIALHLHDWQPHPPTKR